MIGACVEPLPEHGRCFAWLQKARRDQVELCVAQHELIDVYAGLTALDVRPRISPDMARRLIRDNIELISNVIAAEADDYRHVLNEAAALGITENRVTISLTSWLAEKAGVERLITLRLKEFKRFTIGNPAILSEP